MLAGKRLLVTGVLTHRSIAFAVAERAQLAGAELLLTGFGRTRRMTERAAGRLPDAPGRPGAGRQLRGRLGGPRRGASISAGAGWTGPCTRSPSLPQDAIGGGFLATPYESAATAFQTSAYSYAAMARAPDPDDGGGGEAWSGSTSTQRWPGPHTTGWASPRRRSRPSTATWRGTSEAFGIRANLISAGPIGTPAASGIPGFEQLAGQWERMAPLGWDPADATPVADAAVFLLSDLARGISGEVVHVDGGLHAMGAEAPREGTGNASRAEQTTASL